MPKENQIDYLLLLVTILLILFGILVLTSASASISQKKFGNSFYYLKHQVFFGLIPGIFLGYLVFRTDLEILKKWSPALLLVNLLLLGMVFLPGLGIRVRGASRWINLGFFSLQPSEFLKPVFILYLAGLITKWTVRKKNKSKESFFAFLVMIGLISIFLILQPNMSTLLIIISTSLVIYFLAKTPSWHTIFVLILMAIGSTILILIAPYRMARLKILFNPDLDPLGSGYQLKQSLISIGSGGLFGVGLGLSEQKFGFLPQSFSDSIFAILAEETGFVGSLILILLYLIFFWRGFKIGKKSTNPFAQLVAFGITFWITIQAFINMGAMVGILPLTGIPLPFISYGGSSLTSALIGVGLLLNISKNY